MKKSQNEPVFSGFSCVFPDVIHTYTSQKLVHVQDGREAWHARSSKPCLFRVNNIFLRSGLCFYCLMPHLLHRSAALWLSLPCRWTCRLFSWSCQSVLQWATRHKAIYSWEYIYRYSCWRWRKYAFVFLIVISSLLHVTEFPHMTLYQILMWSSTSPSPHEKVYSSRSKQKCLAVISWAWGNEVAGAKGEDYGAQVGRQGSCPP